LKLLDIDERKKEKRKMVTLLQLNFQFVPRRTSRFADQE
jgi:hypothetical protein